MSVWYEKDKERWVVRIRKGGLETRRILPKGINKRQAEEHHTRIMREFFDTATLGKRQNYSIADGLVRIIEEELPKLKSSAGRLSDIRQIQPFTVGKPIEEIPAVAKAYRDANPQLSPASRNRRAHVLRRLATLALRWNWIEKPLYVPMEPEDNARHTYLTIKQIQAVLKAVDDEQAKSFIAIAAYTGMRRSEICALEKIDIGREFISVRTSKNAKPRMVPILPQIRRALKAVPFTYHKDTFSDFASAAGKAAKIPDFRLHDLRHSTASILLNSGATLEVVGQVLGHKSLQTTRRYAHLAPKTAQAALRSAFGGK